MAIQNNASYIPTINEFLAHWSIANEKLPVDVVVATPQKVVVDLAAFEALRDLLYEQGKDVVDILNEGEIVRGTIFQLKEKMLAYLNQFNGLVDVFYANTAYIRGRAKVPSMEAGEDRFVKPMRETAALWLIINGAPPQPGLPLPLELADGTTQAEFAALIGSLQEGFAAAGEAALKVRVERARREMTKATAYEAMKAYRTTLPVRAVNFPELITTLPELSPRPGHTPEAVGASAVFVEPNVAEVSYEASGEKTLARYELRGNPGEKYDHEDAVVIATHGPEDERIFRTTFSLGQPGALICLKVFTVLTTDNEAGSATMQVRRPA